MEDLNLTREHMEIVGSDGQHVGALLRVQNGSLVLAAGDPQRPDPPRVPVDVVDCIDTVIRLNAPARDIIHRWLSARSDVFDSAPICS